jgi:hypothetical protein
MIRRMMIVSIATCGLGKYEAGMLRALGSSAGGGRGVIWAAAIVGLGVTVKREGRGKGAFPAAVDIACSSNQANLAMHASEHVSAVVINGVETSSSECEGCRQKLVERKTNENDNQTKTPSETSERKR